MKGVCVCVCIVHFFYFLNKLHLSFSENSAYFLHHHSDKIHMVINIPTCNKYSCIRSADQLHKFHWSSLHYIDIKETNKPMLCNKHMEYWEDIRFLEITGPGSTPLFTCTATVDLLF